jgi:spore coat protein U-like protein
MTTFRKVGRACLLGIVLTTGALPAGAVTRTANLPVSATVESACNLTTASMDFGTYQAGAAANLDVAGSIRYTQCIGLTLTLELGLGANASGSTRRMQSAAGGFLTYEIYKNSGRTNVFGSGAAGLSVTAPASGAQTLTIYGRVPSGQAVAPGAYTDTVAITLTF